MERPKDMLYKRSTPHSVLVAGAFACRMSDPHPFTYI